MTGFTRILGIDPGSRVTGYGFIDSDGRSSRHVASGQIHTGSGELPRRLRQIHDQLRELVLHYRPLEVAVERVFVHRNADSALKLGQARAAAICATFAGEAGVFEYAARAVKLAVVGMGHADKAQVAHMVAVLLGHREPLRADEADALAVALCHAHSRSLGARLAPAAFAAAGRPQ